MRLNVAMAHHHDPAPRPIQMSDTEAEEPAEEMNFNDMIVEVAKTRSQECFVQLFEHFAPRVKSFLMKGGLSPEQADELSQETMLVVWNKAESYNPKQAAASTWIFTIARNKKIDVFRKNGRVEFDHSDPVLVKDDTASPTENMMRSEQTETLNEAINQLPEDQAFVLRKSFFEDKSHSEIAAETNIPLGTIKSRIRLALERLRGQKKVKELW